MNVTNSLAIFGPNLRGSNESFHIHAAGCKDCRNYGPGKKYGGDNDNALGRGKKFSSKREVVEWIYEDIINESDDHEEALASCFVDVNFAPCVKLPDAVEAAAAPVAASPTGAGISSVEEACAILRDPRASDADKARASAYLAEDDEPQAKAVQSVRFPNARVQLVGQDGNAFAIMGRVCAALRAAGATPAEVKEYQSEAMSGDYNNLLRVTLAWVNDSGVDEGKDFDDDEDEDFDDEDEDFDGDDDDA